MTGAIQEIRFAVRTLAGRPALTLLIITTLALGIGATTTVFSVVDQTLLRSAPFVHGDRLVDVLDIRRGGGGGSSLSPAKILGWQAQPLVFERFEGYSPRQFDLTGGEEPERVQGMAVSWGLFDMLGVQPFIGRNFVNGEGQPGGMRVVILSQRLVQRRDGGDSEVVGSRLVLNDDEYTVVGIMPADFSLQNSELVWVPVDVQAHAGDASTRQFSGIGRLPVGLTVPDAQARVYEIADHLQQATPLRETWDLRLQQKLIASVNPQTRTALLALLGAVGFLLLLTCANVAQLFLTHAALRQRELSIRAALGAGRARLMRQVLTESLLLATVGGAIGVLLARWGVQMIVAAAPANLTSLATAPIGIDRRVLAIAAAVTVLTGLVFGLLPAVRGSRPDLERTLRGHSLGRPSGSFARAASSLVVAEVAFSLVLLMGAALMIRTLANLEAIAPGYDPAGVVARSAARGRHRHDRCPAP